MDGVFLTRHPNSSGAQVVTRRDAAAHEQSVVSSADRAAHQLALEPISMNRPLAPAIRQSWIQPLTAIRSFLICACFPVVSSAYAATAGEQAAPISPNISAPQISEYVREVFQDRDGDFWFGTNGDGVCRYDGKSLTYLSMEEGFGGEAVRGILQDRDGAMWFATNRGVSRYESGVFTNYTGASGLTDDSVWSIMRDSAGTIWAGTHGGVCRFDGTAFVPFPLPRVKVENPESRFTPNVVFGMFEDRAGNLWFGTDGEGVHIYDGTSFKSFTQKDGLAGNIVRCIVGDSQGRVWIGTNGGGASCYDGTGFRNFTKKDGLNNDRIYEILEDKAGNMWFSTLGAGACRYDGTSFTPFREDPGLIINGRPARGHVQEFFEDKDGILWLGCSGGLFRFDGTSFINVTRAGPWPESA
jgi:ligand-binding sensor domain-containing protein